MRKSKHLWLWVAAGVGAYLLMKEGAAAAASQPIAVPITGPGVLQFTGKYAASSTGYQVTLPAGASWIGVNGVAATNATQPMFYPPGISPIAVYSWRDSTGTEQTTTIV